MLAFWLIFMGGCGKLTSLLDIKLDQARSEAAATKELQIENAKLRLEIERTRLEAERQKVGIEPKAESYGTVIK